MKTMDRLSSGAALLANLSLFALAAHAQNGPFNGPFLYVPDSANDTSTVSVVDTPTNRLVLPVAPPVGPRASSPSLSSTFLPASLQADNLFNARPGQTSIRATVGPRITQLNFHLRAVPVQKRTQTPHSRCG
jgi:hypothetical protein